MNGFLFLALEIKFLCKTAFKQNHAHSAFCRNFVKITLFMARPIVFLLLEANRPSQWDDSSQDQANHPSGGPIRPSSVASPVSPISSTLNLMYLFIFYFKVPF